jgi:hypothetical protein
MSDILIDVTDVDVGEQHLCEVGQEREQFEEWNELGFECYCRSPTPSPQLFASESERKIREMETEKNELASEITDINQKFSSYKFLMLI